LISARNILPNNAVDWTQTGVTFTVNADKTITIGGTQATADTTLGINGGFNLPKKDITYYLSGGISNNAYIYLNARKNNAFLKTYAEHKGGDPVAFIPLTSDDYDELYVSFRVTNGTEIANLPSTLAKPMIALDNGSDYTEPTKTNKQLTDDVATIPTVSVSHTGTASSTGVRKEVITINNVSYDVDGSAYMEQSVTLSTSATTDVTFTNAILTANSVIDVGTSKWGVFPTNVDAETTVGTCVVTMPKVDTAITVTVRIYVK
jgi:hypothetical protein